MSFLKELSQGASIKQPEPHKEFNLLNMFKKPEKIDIPQEIKPKQVHPYLQDIKRMEIQKAKQIQDKLNEAKLTPEERRLKAQLQKSKKSFIRVQNGKEEKFKGQKKKGFAQVVEIDWGDNKKKEKQKPKPSIPVKRDQKEVRSKQPTQTSQPNDYYRKQYSKYSEIPKPIKKQKRQHRYSDEDEDEDGFIVHSDEDEDEVAMRELNKFTGKYKSGKYLQNDRTEIRESTFDQVDRQQRVSKAYAIKQDLQELQYENRKRRQKQRRLKQKYRERR